MPGMRRRDVVGLLGGAAIAWPLAVRAQQPTISIVGFLNSQSHDGFIEPLRGFRQGLKDVGYVEGNNVAIEYAGPTIEWIGCQSRRPTWFNGAWR